MLPCIKPMLIVSTLKCSKFEYVIICLFCRWFCSNVKVFSVGMSLSAKIFSKRVGQTESYAFLKSSCKEGAILWLDCAR